MKNLKYFFGLALGMMMTMTFTSCETDDEIGFDISGLYGKLWVADLGEDDEFGDPLESEFEFISGSYNDHGVGRETRYDIEGFRYDGPHSFDWEIRGGDLALYYRTDVHNWTLDARCLYLSSVRSYYDHFDAYVEDDNFRTHFDLIGTRSVDGNTNDELVKPTTKSKRKITFRVKK